MSAGSRATSKEDVGLEDKLPELVVPMLAFPMLRGTVLVRRTGTNTHGVD